jgi:hypothetical protein
LAPDELAALARLQGDQPLTDADIAALNRLDHGPDGPDIDPDDIDPDCAPPQWWLAMSGEEKAWLDDPEPVPAQPEVLDAGFIHRGGSGGIGFDAGGLLDQMDACEALAVCAGRVWAAGLGRLTDWELAGLMGAARRLTSRQAALELAAVGELAARRAGPDGAPGEHLEDEVAALLTLTGPAAARRARRPLSTLLPQPSAGTSADNDAPAGPSPRASAAGEGTRAPDAGVTGAAGPGAGDGTADTRGPAESPRSPAANAPASQDTAPADRAPGTALSGTVNLTIQAGTWLGTSDNPGQSDRYGVLDAGACRDLADTLATHPATRWCITLIDPRRPRRRPRLRPRRPRPTRHRPEGLARHRHHHPGRDRDLPAPARDRRLSALPQPPAHHQDPVPQMRFPGCRRRAVRCDDDHTIPHHQGGRTCECNLHPLCRHHHRTKQAQGWQVTQPEPGVLIWTLPCGRATTTRPEPYPV